MNVGDDGKWDGEIGERDGMCVCGFETGWRDARWEVGCYNLGDGMGERWEGSRAGHA
jgi:hypothetical protein